MPSVAEPVWDLRVIVDAGFAEDAREIIADHGAVVGDTTTTWTAEGVYRGQPTTTRHRAVQLDASVTPGAEEALLALLTRTQVRSITRHP